MPPEKSKRVAASRKARKKPGQASSLTVSDLAQVRILADPLRIRILEELCVEERTTKQVADRLGEKPTKLYHHVEALERVGLIRLARTRQNRGTIEKYYIAVARQFKANSRIFSAVDGGSKADGDGFQGMISTVFERTADELRALIAQGSDAQGIQEKAVVSHLEIRTDSSGARRIEARLMKLIKSFDDSYEAKDKKSEKRYRFTLAFFPIEPD